MPAVNEEGPVKVSVNIHKDGKPTVALAPPPARPGGTNMFNALANSRRVIADPPPPPTQLFSAMGARPPASDASSSYLDDDEDDSEGETDDSRGFNGMEEDVERIKAQKSECLQKLHRYAQQGFPVPQHLGMRSSLEELQGECDRIKRGIDVQNSIAFQRRMLVTFVTGMEYVNGMYDPLQYIGAPSPQLQGWSKNVMSEIDSFDSIFEELFEKYRNRVAMPPELQLFLALSMSAVACHVQNSTPGIFRPGMQQQKAAQPPPPPPPEPEKQPPNRPSATAQPQAQAPAPTSGNDNITRTAPDPPPYVMQGPSGGGLGMFPSPNPVSMGQGGPTLTAISVPAGSAEALLVPPELTVPPRDIPGTIVELPPSPTPSRSRKKAPGRKKAAPSEAGIEL